MKRRPRCRINPRVKIHPAGNVTLSGLTLEDFSWLMSLAANNAYDGLRQARKEKEDENVAEYRYILAILEQIKLRQSAAHAARFGHWSDGIKLTKKARWEKVRQAQKERKLIDSISFEDILADAKKAAEG